MKRVTLFALLLITALLLCGCLPQGNVNHVHITPGKSEVYTQSDIEDAMDIVIRHFRREFEGCTLVHLYYEEDTIRNKSWALQYGASEGIVILSSFETGPDAAGMGLNDNASYNRWQWVLTRSSGGNWVLQSWGYC